MNIISNPKTIRRYARAAETKLMQETFANNNGYKVFKSFSAGVNSSWSFSLNGVKSAYGFNSRSEALEYIYNNKPTAP